MHVPMAGVLLMRITGGHWSKEESLLHINMLEMKPALFAIQIYAKEFFNCTVILMQIILPHFFG